MTLSLRDVLCKIVCFLKILRCCMSLCDFASVETQGWGGGAPQPKQIMTDFICFKTITFDFGRILNSPVILFFNIACLILMLNCTRCRLFLLWKSMFVLRIRKWVRVNEWYRVLIHCSRICEVFEWALNLLHRMIFLEQLISKIYPASNIEKILSFNKIGLKWGFK